MEIKKIGAIYRLQTNISHKVPKLEKNNKQKKIVLEIPLLGNFFYIEIDYFFYNDKLVYKTKIEDPYFILDKNTKKKIENLNNSFILNKC